ncbi:hypothetical protein [Rossellomorea sp. NS-SX7]|uniref:hypothetical protein n=1 Tax=Rossellomorea sp. NS-SX7 TaxID=3463856 RepID=UPI00405981B3
MAKKRHCKPSKSRTSCICEELKNICEGSRIRILYAGGEETFIFKMIKNNCIIGETLDHSPIIFDCNQVVGISVVPLICPQGWLYPGDEYSIPVVPNRVIDSIEVIWENGGNHAQGTLLIDNVLIDTVGIPDSPGSYLFDGLNYPTTDSTDVRILISGGCANIIESSVIYIQPTEPGAS